MKLAIQHETGFKYSLLKNAAFLKVIVGKRQGSARREKRAREGTKIKHRSTCCSASKNDPLSQHTYYIQSQCLILFTLLLRAFIKELVYQNRITYASNRKFLFFFRLDTDHIRSFLTFYPNGKDYSISAVLMAQFNRKKTSSIVTVTRSVAALKKVKRYVVTSAQTIIVTEAGRTA